MLMTCVEVKDVGAWRFSICRTHITEKNNNQKTGWLAMWKESIDYFLEPVYPHLKSLHTHTNFGVVAGQSGSQQQTHSRINHSMNEIRTSGPTASPKAALLDRVLHCVCWVTQQKRHYKTGRFSALASWLTIAHAGEAFSWMDLRELRDEKEFCWTQSHSVDSRTPGSDYTQSRNTVVWHFCPLVFVRIKQMRYNM